MKKKFSANRFVLRSGGRAYRKKQNQDSTQKIQTFKTIKQPTNFKNNEKSNKTMLFDKIVVPKTFSSPIPEISKETSGEYEIGQRSLFVERKSPKSFSLGVVFSTIRLFGFALLITLTALAGVVFGVAQAYVSTTPTLDLGLIEKQDQTSIIYDVNGNVITTFVDIQNRSWATIDEIPDMLKNAIIAVEDVRFYKHNGVDYKRLFGAVISTLRNINAGGGSTLTQQLIKNRVLTNEVSYKRKVQEAYLALQLEKDYTKDQILEGYLNAIYLGGSNYGVKATAEDFLGKSLEELTVRESAMIAGLTQNPARYDPRKNTYERKDMTKTDERTNLVLKRMYSAGFLTKQQYDAALVEQITIIERTKVTQLYDMPYFVEYAVSNIVSHMLRAENLQDNKKNREDMERKLKTGGYHIYTTVDPNIQTIVQKTITSWRGYPRLRDPSKAIKTIINPDQSVDEIVQPQAAAVVLDNKTGQIRAIIGGREEPTRRKLYNRAFQGKMEVGSSIKPIAIYAPAVDSGASPASILLNFASPIKGYGSSEERGYPTGGLKKQGPTTMREGIRLSLNVVAARTLYELSSPEIATQYLVNMGVNPTGIKQSGAGLALGTSGISPLEMAGAYATIARGGLYLEPIAYTKVVDSKGNVILDANTIRVQKQVFKKSTAWLMTDMLQGAVNSGTGTTARIQNMNVAGKTGTNSNYKSVYFAGFTPYFTSSIWIGHDDPKALLSNGATGQKFAAPLWQSYMSQIHGGLVNKPISDNTPEQLGLAMRTICSVSGKIATESCSQDPYHKPVTDWFASESIPVDVCDLHFNVRTCTETGKIATEFCPTTRVSSMIQIKASSPLSSVPQNLVRSAIPNSIFGENKDNLLNAPKGSSNYDEHYCHLHTGYNIISPSNYYSLQRAQELVSRAANVVSSYAMSQDQERQIKELMATISQLANLGIQDEQMQSYCAALESLVAKVVSDQISAVPVPPEPTIPEEFNPFPETPQEILPVETPDFVEENENAQDVIWE